MGLALMLLLAIGLVAARAALPVVLQRYVNRTLDQSPMYEGRVGDVDVFLWRGGYRIKDVRINKTTGSVPAPLFAAEQVDLVIQWEALARGKVVGRIVMQRPALNFVDSESDSEDQTGAGGPWLEIIQDLFPFRINSAVVKQGEIHFQAFGKGTPVDVYIDELEASVENLTNIHDEVRPLVSTVQATGLAMGHAPLEYRMEFNPFSYRPTFETALKLTGLDVTKTNDLARAYGSFDFERGWFDLVVEMHATEGRLEGYVKPLFRNLSVLDLRQDAREDNPIELFWEALVGVATEVLENQPRDQFGTVIPLTGDLTQPETDLLAVVGNVLRNAFVRAYLPLYQSGGGGVQFGPGSVTDQPPDVGGDDS